MNAGTRLALSLLLLPAPLQAQSFLEQFSYEGLRLSRIGFDIGVTASDRLTTEGSAAVRIDYGLIAPRVRVMFGLSYYKADFDAGEIAKFEERLRGVVDDPTGDFSIEVGTIDWTDLEGWIDLQYLPFSAGRFTPYLGLGLGVHLRNGSGGAIDGTFVEDALDTIVAGLNGLVGFEVALSREVSFTADFRGGLTSELRTLTGRGGLMFRIPHGGDQ